MLVQSGRILAPQANTSKFPHFLMNDKQSGHRRSGTSAASPLRSADYAKLLVFALLILPSLALFGVGVIPTIFLIFGLVMARRQGDFSHIRVSVTYVTWYCVLGGALGTSIALWTYNDYLKSSMYVTDFLWLACAATLIATTYVVCVHVLYLKPLSAHSEWVEAHGIFGRSNAADKVTETGMDIIKGERQKNYSVADELLKWAQLRDGGNITAEQFDEARAKLLGRN